jgi:hypothetical protein
MSRLLLTPLLVVTSFVGCQCDDLGQLVPQGSLVPKITELGPITLGQKCTTKVGVRNKGRSDLHIDASELDGDDAFKITKAPTLVRLGATEDLVVQYTADGEVGAVQSTNIELQTDDPRDEGVLRGSITAIPSDGVASVAKTKCGDTTPCEEIAFGAIQTNGGGAILSVTVVNDGTADLTVAGAVIGDDTFGEFSFVGARRGSQVVTLPYTVPAGRTEDCGKPSDADNELHLDVQYLPTHLGGSGGTLIIASDALVGSTLEVALNGAGSDVGLLMSPAFVAFGEVPEGEQRNVDVVVENIGTNDAAVNVSCLDLSGDESCDANCTGSDDDLTLDNSLGCSVTRSNGDAESYGFPLGPTDAQAGGDDQRTVTITWTPTAEGCGIPAGSVLRLESNVLGDRVYEVPVQGGAQGELSYVTDSDDTCPGGTGAGTVCIEAAGTPGDAQTYNGDVTIRLANDGPCSLSIVSIEKDADPATTADDFTITLPDELTLAPGAETTFDVSYQNNDATNGDVINLTITHSGAGGVTLIPLQAIPPT